MIETNSQRRKSAHRTDHRTQRINFVLMRVCLLAAISASLTEAGDFDAILGRMESGSVIKDLLIPRYDEQKKPSMVLRSESLIIESLSMIRAEKLSLHLISSTTANKLAPCHFTIDQCHYHTKTNVVSSNSDLQIESPQFTIHSQGLVTKISQHQKDILAFLHPPVYGYINPEQSNNTTMKSSVKSLLLAGLVAASVAADAPSPAPKDLAELTATPKQPTGIGSAEEEIAKSFFSVSPRSQEVDRKLQDFAKEHQLNLIPLTPTLPQELPDITKPVDEVPQLPKFQPSADALGFTCKGGVFFDSVTSVLTMLNQVTVRNPTYAMTVKKEIKVFFEPEEKKDKPSGIGKVSRMLGVGGVAFEATDEKGVKNYASGDSVLYKVATEEILIKGSKLIFQQGKESRFESANPDAWLLYNKKTKNFTMSDGWNAQLSIPAE